MGFDLFGQSFISGEIVDFPCKLLADVFGVHWKKEGEHGHDVLVYPDGRAELYVNDGDINGFMVSKPSSLLLFDDLFDIMKKGDLVIFWPSSAPCLVVASESVIENLPEDMVQSLGPAVIVKSGADIVAAIQQS